MSQAAQPHQDLERAGERAVLTARRWTQLATRFPTSRASRLLADLLDDPEGLDFTVEFVDTVIRPEDLTVAAESLNSLMKRAPKFLPAWLRMPARLGALMGKAAPEVVVPAARRTFREMVKDLVLDGRPEVVGDAIKKLTANGSRLNLNLLGEAVLGEAEADRRLHETFELLKRDDVDYVSLKVSAVIGPHADWGYEETVEKATERLLPLYLYAASSGEPKFINLDMEEYKDLDLTLDVFDALLERPELRDLEMGIVIQAYLPDSLAAFQRVHASAAKRREKGGAPVKVRLVKGANLEMERVEAQLRGWPVATWDSKKATDANYIRILNWALTPERTDAVQVGVAGHNLFTLALAWELAQIRGVTDAIDFEMLVGMADAQAQAIRDEIGDILLYVPVVHPKEFDVAISYLVRRLEENAADQNYMSTVFEIGTDPKIFDREKERFELALRSMIGEGTKRCRPTRTQDRAKETAKSLEEPLRTLDGQWRFKNTPDTDPSLSQNREWMDKIISRIPKSKVGISQAKRAEVKNVADLDKILDKALRAQEKWIARPAQERANVLHKVGIELALRRAELIEVAGSELGKTVGESDVEVSEAIDFAHYYAQQSLELANIEGATFEPAKLTVVASPWNFPIAIPFGGVAAALAAGSAAVLKPATIAKRCAGVLAEALYAGGVPKALVPLVVPADREVARAVVETEKAERVVLTGSSDTAEMFLGWRPEMGLIGETSGKNAIIVTPTADFDLAVKDIVRSAYGHAGQKCSAASLVILVGSVGTSRRFHNQLLDAVTSLEVDWPSCGAAEMGPLSEVPGEKLCRGLTQLESGQSWAIKPFKKDGSDRLWTPGIRAGVKPGSEFHMVEYFGPILGVMRADTLEEAVDMQNGTDFGLTAGIHSLSHDEIEYWIDHVEAGNTYVNRGITGAIVRRQPFGGWKLSSVGATAKAGGPNYLYSFGTLVPEVLDEGIAEAADAVGSVEAADLTKPQLIELLELVDELQSSNTLDKAQAAKVRQAVVNADRAAREEFDLMNDPSGLKAERNVLRYIPTDAVIRMEGEQDLGDLLTVVAAAVATGTFERVGRQTVRVAPGQNDPNALETEGITISTPSALPKEVFRWAVRHGFELEVEGHSEFYERLATDNLGDELRVRAIGLDRAQIQKELGGDISVSIWDGPVTTAARIEALPFLREQAASLTTHRFGNPTQVTRGILEPS